MQISRQKETCHDFPYLVPKDNQARKKGEISCCFYAILRSEYKYIQILFWLSTGAVQKGNCGMLPWSLGQQIHVQGKPHEDSGLHSWPVGSMHLRCLSHKALLNLHLASLEMLKFFIHILVSLSSSSAFLQPGIPPHCIVSWKSWFGALENFGELILSSSYAKFSTGAKKVPPQILHLKALTNNKTDKWY